MAVPKIQLESAIDALLTIPQAYGVKPGDSDRERRAAFLELHPELVPVIKGFLSDQERRGDFTNAEIARRE